MLVELVHKNPSLIRDYDQKNIILALNHRINWLEYFKVYFEYSLLQIFIYLFVIHPDTAPFRDRSQSRDFYLVLKWISWSLVGLRPAQRAGGGGGKDLFQDLCSTVINSCLHLQ